MAKVCPRVEQPRMLRIGYGLNMSSTIIMYQRPVKQWTFMAYYNWFGQKAPKCITKRGYEKYNFIKEAEYDNHQQKSLQIAAEIYDKCDIGEFLSKPNWDSE